MRVFLWLILVCTSFLFSAAAFAYDPLTANAGTVQPHDFSVNDSKRERTIALRVYLPAARMAAPVVLFSHGLGGSNKGTRFMGEHWAKRGYVAVFLQHAGSDEAVWKDKNKLSAILAMKRAVNYENFQARIEDVHRVIDALTAWNQEANHPLADRLNLNKIGMSGHSFGAITTQAVSGQHFEFRNVQIHDPRIRAAIMFSPSPPKHSHPEEAFSSVKIPWLLITGTKDDSPMILGVEPEDRLLVFAALPESGHHYELVLHEAAHSAFTDRALPADKATRNPNHHRAILALSTAFWDSILKSDKAAKAWLDGPDAASVLEAQDRWKKK